MMKLPAGTGLAIRRNKGHTVAVEATVLIVDDHPLIRMGLQQAVTSVEGLQVCGVAGSLAEAEAALEVLQPDAIILDMHLPDGDGLQLLRNLKKKNLEVPALMFSICDEEIYAPRMFAAGARGFVMKDQPVEIILSALEKVLKGHLAFSDAVVTRLLAPRGTGAGNPLGSLTARELSIARLFAMGLRNKEVAARIHLSPQTIGTYKLRILRKLGLQSQFELKDFLQFNDPESLGRLPEKRQK